MRSALAACAAGEYAEKFQPRQSESEASPCKAAGQAGSVSALMSHVQLSARPLAMTIGPDPGRSLAVRCLVETGDCRCAWLVIARAAPARRLDRRPPRCHGRSAAWQDGAPRPGSTLSDQAPRR